MPPKGKEMEFSDGPVKVRCLSDAEGLLLEFLFNVFAFTYACSARSCTGRRSVLTALCYARYKTGRYKLRLLYQR
jgi:hypothetical protein